MNNIEDRRGRGMPLPSGMSNSTQKVVYNLRDLWLDIFTKKTNLDREKTAAIVNDFYEGLDIGVCQWLEEDDPRYKKSRGILAKENAMQTAQIKNTPLLKRHYRGKRKG